MRTRHTVFHREQILALAKVMKEFPGIIGVDFEYIADTLEPLRMEYLWEDEE